MTLEQITARKGLPFGVVQLLGQVNGNYIVELDPGVYMIDINRLGIDSSSESPGGSKSDREKWLKSI